MNKVIVIGCPGSGKSVFSRELHRLTGMPLFHLDMLNWNSDRTTVPKKIFIERLESAINEDSWIIDGNYGSTMEIRFKACDTVFFLDYPKEICLEGIRSRRGKERPDMPWIEAVDEEDQEFISFVESYNAESRPQVLKLLEKYKDKDIVVFKNRNEADEYLKGFCNLCNLSEEDKK